MTADPIARELGISNRQVTAVLSLLAEGGTVPFIARYRKEATGALDEVAIRDIEAKHRYAEEFESRRATVRDAIQAQGKLTEELSRQLEACRTKTELEDFYLPFKAKRRTRASMARDRGLSPLADRILAQPDVGQPHREARGFISDE